MSSLRRSDEYQRLVQLEALAIGFGVVILVAFVGNLLAAAGIGDTKQALQITFEGGVIAWVVALMVKAARGL
ncbi:MAG: hypothetical protein WCB04_12985 [Mycobacteriales bacterium]